jgi:Protein of unknown function (DUF1579)
VDAEREFDFLEGEWDAVCRVPANEGWAEAPGTLTASRTLDGLVSVEHFEGIYHGGALKGLGLRAFNRETREWEHTWTDTLAPGHFQVWKGAFSGGTIDLFATWIDESGTPVRSRLTWSRITADSAHWESARSSDGGKTWQVHWVIDFRRLRRPTLP